MIKLSKTDLENIAYTRFKSKYDKWFFGGLIVLLGVMLAVGLTMPPAMSTALQIAVLSPFPILFLLGAFYWLRRSQKYTRDFIKDCEADPTFIYQPDKETPP